jgi:sugar (pentulose or hexulose) kinase
MATELYDMYLQMQPLLRVQPEKMVGSGNGLRSNAPLVKIFSEIFGLPLSIPANKEEAAFGSALFGMVAAGIYPDLPAAQALIRYL